MLEIGLAEVVHPAQQLAGAKRLLTDLGAEGREAVQVVIEQIDRHQRECRSTAAKKYAISVAAVAGPSEPCTAFASMLVGEIRADRAGCRLLRIGGAHQVAILLDRVFAFQHLDHHRAGDHELDQVGEEGPLAVHGVEALSLRAESCIMRAAMILRPAASKRA